MSNCLFDSNQSPSGGALSVRSFGKIKTVIKLRNIKFINNEAQNGGAIIFQSSAVLWTTLESLYFGQNKASGEGGGGGAIKCVGEGSIEIIDSQFDSNTAARGLGGSIQVDDTTVVVTE